MDTKQFILENDIMNKMRAALEQIAVGQGFSVFEGLETGTCSIGIVYDGTNISFHKLERLKPEEIKIAEPLEPTVGVDSAPMTGGADVARLPEAASGSGQEQQTEDTPKRKRARREHEFGEGQP